MRKCQAPTSPECFAEGIHNCGLCGKWFCTTHYQPHSEECIRIVNTSQSELLQSRIEKYFPPPPTTLVSEYELLGVPIVLSDIARSEIRMHPRTLCQLLSTLLQHESNMVASDSIIRHVTKGTRCAVMDDKGQRCVEPIEHPANEHVFWPQA